MTVRGDSCLILADIGCRLAKTARRLAAGGSYLEASSWRCESPRTQGAQGYAKVREGISCTWEWPLARRCGRQEPTGPLQGMGRVHRCSTA